MRKGPGPKGEKVGGEGAPQRAIGGVVVARTSVKRHIILHTPIHTTQTRTHIHAQTHTHPHHTNTHTHPHTTHIHTHIHLQFWWPGVAFGYTARALCGERAGRTPYTPSTIPTSTSPTIVSTAATTPDLGPLKIYFFLNCVRASYPKHHNIHLPHIQLHEALGSPPPDIIRRCCPGLSKR